MLNLILFGPPGSGKGTQSVKLAKRYNLIHLSTGDMLRSQIAKGTELGLAAKAIMDRGELVSDRIVIGMIETQLNENPDADGFIFDGFPRTTIQAIALDDLLEKHHTSIAATLSLEVNKPELIKRLLERGKESGRPDDRNETVIENRVHEYTVKTSPLIEYYKEEGKYRPVYGMGNVDEVFDLLCHEIDHLDAGDVHGEGVLESVHHHPASNKTKNKKQTHHKKQNLMSHQENHNQHNHGNGHDEHHDEKHDNGHDHNHGHEHGEEKHHGHEHHEEKHHEHAHHEEKHHGHEEHEEKHHGQEHHEEKHHVEHKAPAAKKAAPAKKPAAKKVAAKKPAPKKAAPKKKKAAPKKKKAAPKKAHKKAAKKHAPKKAHKKAAKKHAPKKAHKKAAKKHAPKKAHKKAAKKHAPKKAHKAKGKKKR